MIYNALSEAGCIYTYEGAGIKLSSGIMSNTYIDCRRLWSSVSNRNTIIEHMTRLLSINNVLPDVIVGIATGGIPPGILLADRLRLPFVYARSAHKEHGTKSLIEGRICGRSNILIVEDHITTGATVFNIIDELTKHEHIVKNVISITDYGLETTISEMDKRNIAWIRLATFDAKISEHSI